MVKQITHNMFL